MATGISIGPRIGIEGAAEFQRQIRTITSEFKSFEAEIKKASATFEKNGDLLALNERKTYLLNRQMGSLNAVIEKQKVEIMNANREWGAQVNWTEAQKKQYHDLNTALSKNVAEYTKLEIELDNVTKETQEYVAMNQQLDGVIKQINFQNLADELKTVGDRMVSIGKTMSLLISVPIGAFLGSSIKTAADWESGMTGVKKTVDEIIDENDNLIYSYEDLDAAFKKVASETVLPYEELLAVGEIAGQLGISADKVAEFSDIMLKLGASTTMTSEEAATNIAKILNITNKGVPFSNEMVQKFSDTLVELGNNFATTEGDITLMATRLASAGTIAGLTTQDILALSTAMSAAGIRAEAGGSSLSQVLVNLEKRVAHFSEGATDELDTVARLAGMSADEFAKSWKDEPIVAVSAFIKGLGELDEQAESTSIILEELDMDGIRQSNTLKALSLAYPMLSDAIGKANEQWNKGGALMTEYTKRTEDYNSRLQNFRNNWALLKEDIGTLLLPVLEKLLEIGAGIVKWLKDMPDGIQLMLVGFGGIVAATGPVLIALGSVARALSSLIKFKGDLGGSGGLTKIATSLANIGNNGSTAATGVGSLGTALGKVGAEGTAAATGIDGVTASLGTGAGGGLFGAMYKFLEHPFVKKGGIAGLIFYAGYAAFNFEEEVAKWKTSLEGFGTFLDGLGQGSGNLIAKYFGYDSWDEASADLDTWTTNLKEKISNWSTELMGETEVGKGAMDQLLQDIKDTSTKMVEDTKQRSIIIAQTTDDLGNELIALNQAANTQIQGDNTKHFEVVNTAVKGYKTSTIQDFEETEKGMIGAIDSNRPKVVSGMEQTADEAQAPITDLKALSPGWGSDLISGFVSGIYSMYGAVISAVSGIANIVSSWLHFSRPDVGPLREYEKWMPDFMQGLADGINSNAWRVEEAMSNLSSDMALNVTGTTKPLANQNSFNYGGVVINLNVPEGANGQMLVDEIEQELSNRVLRRKAVFG